MSTIFSSTGLSRSSSHNKHRRSQSTSRIEKVKESRRMPALSLDSDYDLNTNICVELSKCLLKDPDLNLNAFFKTTAYARRDIAKSDTTILVTAAILQHLGGKKSVSDQLKKSATCAKLYERLNLNEAAVREVFVTMILGMNEEFVKMIEKSIMVLTERSAELGNLQGVEFRHDSANVLLNKIGLITPAELNKNLELESRLDMKRAVDFCSSAAEDTIRPEDSVTVIRPRYKIDDKTIVEKGRRRNSEIDETDLLTFIARSRKGVEPKFNDVFRTAKEPVEIKRRDINDKTGLGYNARKVPDKAMKRDVLYDFSKLNKDLSRSIKVRDINLKTGEEFLRTPRVEDTAGFNSVSNYVFRTPTEVEDYTFKDMDINKFRKPSPTELYLPDSVVIEEIDKDSTREIKTVDSFEALRESFQNVGL